MSAATLSGSRQVRRAAAVLDRRRSRKLRRALETPPKLADARPGSLSGVQSICLSMIVKNENGPHLFRCLDSVRPFITSWAIVDTGSTDGTQDAIRRYMADVPGELIEREWVDDFAHSRNQALDLARDSGADFAMIMDADDYVEPRGFRPVGDGCVELPALLPMADDVTVFLSVGQGILSPRRTFVRLSAPICWRGRLHEDLLRDDGGAVSGRTDPAYVVRITREGAAARSVTQPEDYLRICLRGVESDPDDFHLWSCLVEDFLSRGNYPEARRCADRALLCSVALTDPDRRYVIRLGRVMTLHPIEEHLREIAAEIRDLMDLCPERAEAPKWMAGEFRKLGRAALADQLDALADAKPMPAHGYRLDHRCYAEGRATILALQTGA